MDITQILAKVESTIKDKNEYAYFLIHEARYKRILEEIEKIVDRRQQIVEKNNPPSTINHLRSPRVLDVGCFPYHMGKALEVMGYEVWGIASAHEPIANKNISILNIETDKFPYKNNFFDLVLCSEVVEHLPHSPVPAIREMYRVTKPTGHVLITTPNIARSINQGKMLLGRAPVYSIDAFLENGGLGSNLYHRHNREFTLAELTRLTRHAGWQIDKATHFVSYPPFRRRNRKDNPFLWTGKLANFLAMKAIPRLADTLLIIGKK